MSKKWMQRLFALAMVFCMAAGQCVTGFADGGDPSIVVGGDNVFDVEAGKSTKISLQIKNKGAGTAENVHIQAKSASAMVPYRVSIQGGGDLGDIGTNGYKNVTLNITWNGTVEEPNYAVALDYTYNSSGGSSYSGSNTILSEDQRLQSGARFCAGQHEVEPRNTFPRFQWEPER